MMYLTKDVLKKTAVEIIKKEKVNYYSNLYNQTKLIEEEKEVIKKNFKEVEQNENK